MNVKKLLKDQQLTLYVNDIFVFEEIDTKAKTKLPFFADGYPGMIFLKATNDAFLLPKKKKLTELFLYGQTLEPIEISLQGSYQMIVFQLFPFVLKSLFNVNPKELNDDCYDLKKVNKKEVAGTIDQLKNITDRTGQVRIMADYISNLTKKALSGSDTKIRFAIDLVVHNRGKVTVKSLCDALFTTERTLQRLFIDHVGISPKQFARIIQFQHSMQQISDESFTKLTEVVYKSGYADQSHLIRSVRKFTHQKPSALSKKK